MNIGIIGAGAIARFLLKEINQQSSGDMKICSVFIRRREKYLKLEDQFNVTLYDDLDAFLKSGINVVVEAANVEAVRTLVPKVILEKDVVVISVGAFAEMEFYQEIKGLAFTHRRKIHLPSGAIGGLDLLQNANVAEGVRRVSLTTRKPAGSLIDRPITEKETIFAGKASEAIKQYPKNINVSIILSIAGVGVEETMVNIIADPTIDSNVHTIEIEGDFGEATFTIQNNPLAENPKTSHLAAMSVLGTLKRLEAHITLGN